MAKKFSDKLLVKRTANFQMEIHQQQTRLMTVLVQVIN
jgi:hypothetical protein